MPYTVKIKRQAKRKLRTLPRPERQRIAEKIHNLGLNPDDKELDVKKLEGEEGLFRLRVGDWRVIFNRQDELKIIAIEKIKPRGDAYK
jgi:mRNA interferase RelE/StbE